MMKRGNSIANTQPLITKEGANEVKTARGSPKPTKYGQLDSTYTRRFGAVHPIFTHLYSKV